jgi:hypothetical protein
VSLAIVILHVGDNDVDLTGWGLILFIWAAVMLSR